MKKYKKIIITIFIFIFFFISWMCYYYESIAYYKTLSCTNLFNQLFNYYSGYNSIFSHSVFNLIVYILSLSKFYNKESNIFVIRNIKRKRIFYKRFLKIILFSFVFSLLNVMVNVVMTIYFFYIPNEMFENFLLAILLQSIMLTFHYLIVGIIFYLIFDVNKKFAFSLILTFLMFSIITILNYNLEVKCFFPISNPGILIMLLKEKINIANIISRYVAEISILSMCFLLGDFIHERKNYYKNESV
ncbi:MAG: WxPxxD family membrane protein [Oscillospiraceae bacterium]